MNQMGDQSKKFTNVFIKNFGESLDTQKLKEMFESFGKILSCKVPLSNARLPEIYKSITSRR